MSDFKITSLDVLAEAALLFSDQINNESINAEIVVPKKRKFYRYEAEKITNSDDQTNKRLNSNSSGYSSTNESPNHLTSSSPELFSSSSSLMTFETSKSTSTKKSTKSSTRSSSKLKKVNSTSTKQNISLKEFAKNVSLTPKIENEKEFLDLNENNVLDANVKIEVKTPRLTFTLRGLRKRKPSTKTPDYLKDQDYFVKRERNNLAAKKSRNNKHQAIRTSELKFRQLEKEREELDLQLGKEIMIMKLIQEKMNDDVRLKQRVMDLVDERQLDYFKKVLELN